MPTLLTYLLLPFAWLYAGIIAVRNWLYDRGWKLTTRFSKVPVLGVGNLRVGGTGKTPHVAWLVQELRQQGQQPAILSRGYGRRTRGFRLGSATETAATLGDEPWQQFTAFGGQVPVAVCEDRLAGLHELLRQQPQITTVVLDDAYQHRRVRPDFSVLLTEQQRPFYHDYVLPAGRLRESRTGAARADVVVVTKCDPQLTTAQQLEIEQRIRRYGRRAVPVLFSTYAYGAPVPLPGVVPDEAAYSAEIVLLTGIAQPLPLRKYLREAGYQIVHYAEFNDHHAFTAEEIAALKAHYGPGRRIFTTQKDAARLLDPSLHTEMAGLAVFYIPIAVEFLADGANRLRQLLPAAIQPQAVV
ncbi:tetraacyldisaccharide 4'-kinase [Hymenobacter sp. BT186]|uniref:Tetraacyldisaccharide 4'-kinase n=1 Tax=Hymenobacter telluris TaxID=2816474 RepID=A0A939JBZ9_9BACT|nr:tetraacyldisaccharide 4'-kinase [Hymenobacter telluris]MBO0357835.1 tetraacyldisaccharide 4'-kinase [Hymenobacter telluris]MBW3373862.1 tetraacyldisaccharide 4'-kinase [Hymenobacter norwichensis]